MYTLDFNKKEHVHFIGIGGISMSGLAEILIARGFTVSGSDTKASDLTAHLERLGAKIIIGQKAENITPAIDTVVYTAAVHEDNPELAKALSDGKNVLRRAELLGLIMKNYSTAIGIAGTHGKTTTTSMCSEILMKAALDPTISVGGILPSIGGNIRIGKGDTFITEACEYTNSYHHLFPNVAAILNVDADHLDFFRDLDDIAESFHKYAALLPENGTLVIYKDSNKYSTVVDRLSCRITTFGFGSDSDVYPAGLSYNEFGFASFTAMYREQTLGKIELSVPGKHNTLNALAAIAVSLSCGISYEDIRDGLLSFKGAKRRFEIKGDFHGAKVIDDYAHHPSEIRATLDSAMKYPHRTIWLVFQPHTYTRTKALLEEFASALSLADHVILGDIYAAREKNTLGISSADVRDKIAALGTDAIYLKSFAEIEDFLLENAAPGDLIITMGAGDIYQVGDHLLSRH